MSNPSASMTLQVLGSGAAFSRRYGTTCSVLTLASGDRWLIDCGRQAPDQLARAGIAWHQLKGQLVTHVHGDHVYGIEEFAFVRYYNSNGDQPSVMAGGERPLLAAHSAVLGELWEVLAPSLRYRSTSDGRAVVGTLDDYFEVLQPAHTEPPAASSWNHAEHFESPQISIVARETLHVLGKPSTSFELPLPGPGERIAWWSGDSVVDAGLLERLEPRTSVFFHDCTFTDFPGQVHGLFSAFERLRPSLRSKIVLMHHEDDIEQHRARVEAQGMRLCMPGDVYDLVSGKLVDRV